MAALRILPPAHYVGRGRGHPARSSRSSSGCSTRARRRAADGTCDGDVYFSVHADPAFGDGVAPRRRGRCSRCSPSAAATRSGRGKKHPLDALLWRVTRPGEPAWDGGPLGHGRPGWHIECTAIALDHLGARFDVQGGGTDLFFPHHEMSAAHAAGR